MKKLILALLLVGGSMFSSKAVIHVVTISGFTFSPMDVNATVGDTVAWIITGTHNATEVDATTYAANGTTPLGGGFAFTQANTLAGNSFIVVTAVGIRYYVCTVHVASMGMKGRILTVASGVDENKNDVSINLYPNPAAETLNLAVNNAPQTPVTIEIVNILGKKVMDLGGKQTLNNDTRKIDVSALPRGIYFLNIVGDNRTRSFRFVKK